MSSLADITDTDEATSGSEGLRRSPGAGLQPRPTTSSTSSAPTAGLEIRSLVNSVRLRGRDNNANPSPPTSTATASRAEEVAATNDSEEVQDPNSSAGLEMPDEEDQGLSPPAQIVTVREERDEEGGMSAPEVMDEGEGLPPSNLELDEATGIVLRKAAKEAPTTINDYTGPSPLSFQGGNKMKEKDSMA